jgi:SAM-dependent methyltransferase
MTRYGQEWQTPEFAANYRDEQADAVPRRAEGESALTELLPASVGRVLDVGTGDGRMIALVRATHPGVPAIGIDFSEPMLDAARERFAGDDRPPDLRHHDLSDPLPGDLGTFDLVVSSLAIHHLPDERKRTLYRELFDVLEPDGLFLHMEHVASATPRLERDFYDALGLEGDADASDQLVLVEHQCEWLREIGFEDVDCLWKWRELALMHARRPA